MGPLLNLDGGEHEDEPAELYSLADVVHVACGGHAGDDASMDRVARACIRAGTRIGAHPSYEDREGFGRRTRQVASGELASSVATQCARLRTIAERGGGAVTSVKAHGALYHSAHADADVARACLEGLTTALGNVTVVGLAGGALEAEAHARGVRFLREAFADRGVGANGALIPRGEPGAIVEDEALAAARATELASRDDVDTICIHADTPGALRIARAVREALGPRVP
jgi:UPF0271 protein